MPENRGGLSAAGEECSFEDSLSALEQVVRDLEDGNLGLTAALDRYETGVKHLKRCYRLLEAAERRIELLTGVNEDGTPATEPFVESSESLAESAGRRRRPRAKTAEKTTDRNEGSDSMT
jgi:exodeoxyribonuclease VII small subunit